MLLQLQKSYKGDTRFRLDAEEGFAVNPLKDKGEGKNVQLPETMLGALTKREKEALLETSKKPRRSSDIIMERQADDLDTGTI